MGRHVAKLYGAVVAFALVVLGCASIVTTDGSATIDAADHDSDAGVGDGDGDGAAYGDGAGDSGAPADAPPAASIDAGTTSITSSTDTDTDTDAGRLVGDGVAASFAAFVADWDGLNATLHADNPEIARIEVHESDFVHGAGLGDEDVFAGQVSETAIIGGTIGADDGVVRTVVVGVDPDGDTAAPVVITTFGVTAAPGEPIADLVAAYQSIAAGPVGADIYLVSGANGFVVQKVEGAEADDPFVLVTVAPEADDQLAREEAATAQVAVFDTLLDG